MARVCLCDGLEMGPGGCLQVKLCDGAGFSDCRGNGIEFCGDGGIAAIHRIPVARYQKAEQAITPTYVAGDDVIATGVVEYDHVVEDTGNGIFWRRTLGSGFQLEIACEGVYRLGHTVSLDWSRLPTDPNMPGGLKGVGSIKSRITVNNRVVATQDHNAGPQGPGDWDAGDHSLVNTVVSGNDSAEAQTATVLTLRPGDIVRPIYRVDAQVATYYLGATHHPGPLWAGLQFEVARLGSSMP